MIVFSTVACHTEFIELQQLSWGRCRPGIRFVVVNNGPHYDAVDRECHRLHIECLRVPPYPHHDPSRSHAAALNFAWRHATSAIHDDIMLIDMDVFPLEAVDLYTLVKRGGLAGLRQVRGDTEYLWPGFLLVSREAPNRTSLRFDPGCYLGNQCDTGGAIAEYVARHPALPVRYVDQRAVVAEDLPVDMSSDFRPECGWHLIDGGFLHLTGGTNWRGLPGDVVARRNLLANRWVRAACGEQ